jgi:hypothetical protein
MAFQDRQGCGESLRVDREIQRDGAGRGENSDVVAGMKTAGNQLFGGSFGALEAGHAGMGIVEESARYRGCTEGEFVDDNSPAVVEGAPAGGSARCSEKNVMACGLSLSSTWKSSA